MDYLLLQFFRILDDVVIRNRSRFKWQDQIKNDGHKPGDQDFENPSMPFPRNKDTKRENLQGVLSTIVMESSKPWRPLLGLSTPSNRCVKIVGTSKSPTPKDRAAATMKRSRRVHRTYASTRKPEAITLAKRKVVTPPRTGFGTGWDRKTGWRKEETRRKKDSLARKTPEIFPRTPKSIRKAQQKRPAVRFAHRVIAMTPLFCAKTDRGATVNKADMKPPIPSD